MLDRQVGANDSHCQVDAGPDGTLAMADSPWPRHVVACGQGGFTYTSLYKQQGRIPECRLFPFGAVTGGGITRALYGGAGLLHGLPTLK